MTAVSSFQPEKLVDPENVTAVTLYGQTFSLEWAPPCDG